MSYVQRDTNYRDLQRNKKIYAVKKGELHIEKE